MRKHYLPFVVCAILAFGGLTALNTPVQAALDPYDPPTIECFGSTLNSLTLKICAGATGSPAGLTLQWKKLSDWEATGWSDENLCKLSMSGQPSLQHPGKSRWELLPGECETIIIGDINFDETGVSGSGCGLDALECGTDYIFRAFSHAGRGMGRSDWTDKVTCSTSSCTPQCTHSQGYWKTHGAGTCHQGANLDEWPATAFPMQLGSLFYTPAQACASLNVPAGGNGLVSLAHQLIAAKLNLANGATNCPSLAAAIASADALINGKAVPPNPPQPQFLSPALTSPLTLQLDAYNNGGLCFPNCHGGAPQARLGVGADVEALTPNGARTTWGKLKAIYR